MKPPPRNIVIVGGGIQGTSVAYQMAERLSSSSSSTTAASITVLESIGTASAASGKGGGFMAKTWGDGTPTEKLHRVAFDMYEDLAKVLQCDSYRKLPVLSVSPAYDGLKIAKRNKQVANLLPNWLDGTVGRISPMGYGDDTAQITPHEVVTKMLKKQDEKIRVVLGTCTGMETDQGSGRGTRKIIGVRYKPSSHADGGDGDVDDDDDDEIQVLPADVVVVSAGPWSCEAENWFRHTPIHLPMQGIKSTSIVWKKPEDGIDNVDATALFCGEDDRFGTHLEVYPRPNGEIYICGVGGSEYVPAEALRNGAYRGETCRADPKRTKAAVDSFSTMSSVYERHGELEKSQACMRPCPPDALPYMGSIPGYEGAYINAGHNCWGIAWAPACGRAMTELVFDGRCSWIDLSPFEPSRFTRPPPADPSSGGTKKRGRKQQGTSVGEQW